jgi:outer membrane protein OmpA-like peptidoglycan-associated protein
MPLPIARRDPAPPAPSLALALATLTLLAACGPSQPPLMKRVEDASASPPRAPIVVVQPRPVHAGESGAAATRGLVVPPSAGAAAATPDASVIYFGHDRYQVDEAYAPLLHAHAKRLLSDPGLMLRIDAFTDESGPADYNLELSRMRALTVQRELRALGVPARQMQGVGHGPEGGGRGAQANARRVELSYR